MYTFGCGMFGQLGTGSVQKQSYPQQVNIPERIQLIASGYFHVVCFIYKNLFTFIVLYIYLVIFANSYMFNYLKKIKFVLNY